ncbi:solute carrier family 35 member B1 homolog isoform X2 [Culicoides brevitarsis]|uniref:solute carrier family 35 member B1 homolog isoform X2 n=1 Tax=Culicoides brevitarsis TaxID=469753 RepID=UPI00307BFFE4
MKIFLRAREMVFLHPKVRFLCASLGLTISFIIFSLLHEKLVKTEYSSQLDVRDASPHKEHFYYFQTLLAVLCLVSAIVARVLHKVLGEKTDTTSVPLYLSNSFFYVLATLCSSYSLKWVSYPVQIVAKCASPIPTLVLCVLIGKCRYRWHKYVFTKGLQESLWYGEILLAVSLLMDGLCGGIQDRIRHTSEPPTFAMMSQINLYSAIFVIIGATSMNELSEFLSFVNRHPHVLYNIAVLTIMNVIGQIFVYAILTTNGSLACSYATTVRKLFSILLSVILFRHVIQWYQWVGLAVTFGVLFLDTVYSDNDDLDDGKLSHASQETISTTTTFQKESHENPAFIKDVVIPIESPLHTVMASNNGKSLS